MFDFFITNVYILPNCQENTYYMSFKPVKLSLSVYRARLSFAGYFSKKVILSEHK
jgi:hypothetical protein